MIKLLIFQRGNIKVRNRLGIGEILTFPLNVEKLVDDLKHHSIELFDIGWCAEAMHENMLTLLNPK